MKVNAKLGLAAHIGGILEYNYLSLIGHCPRFRCGAIGAISVQL